MEEGRGAFIKNPIVWGWIGTAAVVGIGIWSAFLPACFEHANGVTSCPSKWFYLKQATPNEVGDTLAGFAGALAFIWIIVTVAMQSKELQEQRTVLSLQRAEMEEQRKATQEMAQAAAVQAEIFKKEQVQREQDAAREKLEERLRTFLLELSECGLVWHFSNEYIDDELNSYGDIFSQKLWNQSYENKTIDEAIWAFRTKIKYFAETLHDNIGLSVGVILPKNLGQIDELTKRLSRVLEIRPFLSDSQIERLDRMSIPDAISHMKELAEDKKLWRVPDQ